MSAWRDQSKYSLAMIGAHLQLEAYLQYSVPHNLHNYRNIILYELRYRLRSKLMTDGVQYIAQTI